MPLTGGLFKRRGIPKEVDLADIVVLLLEGEQTIGLFGLIVSLFGYIL